MNTVVLVIALIVGVTCGIGLGFRISANSLDKSNNFGDDRATIKDFSVDGLILISKEDRVNSKTVPNPIRPEDVVMHKSGVANTVNPNSQAFIEQLKMNTMQQTGQMPVNAPVANAMPAGQYQPQYNPAMPQYNQQPVMQPAAPQVQYQYGQQPMAPQPQYNPQYMQPQVPPMQPMQPMQQMPQGYPNR